MPDDIPAGDRAPRPAPRPCTTTKPVLKPNPYEEASEPGDVTSIREAMEAMAPGDA